MRKGIGPLAVAGIAALAGCETPFDAPSDPDPAIKRYYALHASEQDGACRYPEIAAIRDRESLNATGARSIWRVRYSYYDEGVAADTDWPYVLTTERVCTGLGEREFTLLERPTGYAVLDMSGERRSIDE